MEEIKNLKERLEKLEKVFGQHIHNGTDSQLIPLSNILPSFVMTPTQLTAYKAANAINGAAFTCYDGTDYTINCYINGLWKSEILT